MQRAPLAAHQRQRIETGVRFVESLARRVAATMPHSIDLGDLVQDGMIGLIDAARRFDEHRGIKFETFAERRVRGAMIDALRRDAWPRGVRRVRRELEAAREALRRELGAEPSLADLAARVGSDEARLGRTIVRINTIESTSPIASAEHTDTASLPPVLVPSEVPAPDRLFEQREVRDRIRAAVAALPPRERRLIGLYYFGEVTMREIGAQIGVNESRVSQLHARAIQRLRKLLCADAPEGAADSRAAVVAFSSMLERMKAAKAREGRGIKPDAAAPVTKGVVLPYARPTRSPRMSRAHQTGGALKRPHLRRVAMGR
jgi:RNA polymerase sigma factor for flagellar operon FliA